MHARWLKFASPLLILGLGVGGYQLIMNHAKKPEEKPAVDTRPTIEFLSLKAEDYPVTLIGHGEVRPLEQTQLASQVAGEVRFWHPDFVPGGLVKRGEVLLRIEPDNYEAAVLQAEAALFSAEAVWVEEKARAKVAEEEVRRMQSPQRADLFLRKPQLLSAEAAVKSAQAGLKRARRDLANCEVKAPYDALILSRQIGLGQFVHQGATVAVLNNIEAAEIMMPVSGFDQPMLPEQLAGTPAEIQTSGPEMYTRQATIERDLGVVDQATRMSHLVVRLNDPYSLNSTQPPIKFGSYVAVRFQGKTLHQVYKLPQEVVNNRKVWLVSEDMRLIPRKVEIARQEDTHFLVQKGLADGERLVTTLPEYPQADMVVKTADTEVR